MNLGNNLGLWTYAWMGYSFERKEMHVYIKYPTGVEKLVVENARHFVPKYFSAFWGADGMLSSFNGVM